MTTRQLAFLFVLALVPAWALAQEEAILTGKVTDEAGTPLIQANVSVVGHPFVAATGRGGTYRLAVDEKLVGQEIEVRTTHVGHRSATRKVRLELGTNTQDFALEIDVLELEGIVVTAMGVGVPKEKLGVTIDKVSAEEIVNSDEVNIVSALSGKAANVEVTTTSRDPGAGAYIRIRGVNSIVGGTQPLFIVDGTPINNQSITDGVTPLDQGVGGVTQQNRASDLNPEDIASVEILKGAAAAAMYGSRAANGVVLITTKSGSPGRTKASYKLSYTFDQVDGAFPLQRRYGQGRDGVTVMGSPFS